MHVGKIGPVGPLGTLAGVQADDDRVRRGSFYDDPEVFERYSEHRRGGVSSPNDVMEHPAVLRALGSVAGLRVLDLGCGDAAFGRELLDLGAGGYLGIDGSVAMAAQAEHTLAGTVGRVVRADLEDLDVPDASVDLVVSRLALHYLRDLPRVLAACHRALVPGGRLVITVLHPVITSHDTPAVGGARTDWVVDDYFEPGPRERPWLGGTVLWYHRTIEQHVDAVVGAGFRLTALSECEPVAELFEGDVDELRRRRRVPLFLLLAACRD